MSEEWHPLWRSDPHATPFQSPEWLLPWCTQFCGGDLCTVAIRNRGALIGLLPMYIYYEPRSGKRQLLPIGVSTSDYLDGIFAPECTADDIRAALQLLADLREWDAGYLTQLRAGSMLLRALEGVAMQTFPTEACSRVPALRMSDLPQKLRRNAMYYRNRAERAGRLDFRIADESNCGIYFEALHRLHTERWQQCGQPGVLADPRVVRWHREAVPLLARHGLLRLCALELDGEPIAVLYSFIDPPQRAHRTQYIYLPAFSPRHADLRPGTVLQALAMEHAADEGAETIDLLRGDEAYKQIWHAERTSTFGLALQPTRAGMVEAA